MSAVRGRVVVVGGGLAGITAALGCADAGHDVVLLEAKPRLGGLTTSFPHGQLTVDNGQHVFLRCCTRYLALLDRLGVRDRVVLQPRLDVPVLEPGGREHRLSRSDLPAPAHLVGALLRYRALTRRQRLSVVRAVLALRRVRRDDPATDGQSFGAFLARHGQDARTVAALWDLVGIATLNARADDASLALAATVFQIGLLEGTDAGDIGWAAVPLAELHAAPALERLHDAGVEVRQSAKVTALREAAAPGPAGGWVLEVRDRDGAVEVLPADQVVLAVPPDAAQRLLPAGVAGLPEGFAERLGAVPIVNVHVVYDRVVLDRPFAAGLGSPVQWVFDRTAQSGLADGQLLAVSLSAADDLVDLPVAALRDLVVPALAELLPAARTAEVTDVFVTRERAATFRPAPGTRAVRPGPDTGRRGLVLAGAWTSTGWPATMEGAVRSGEAAVAQVCAGAGDLAPAGVAA